MFTSQREWRIEQPKLCSILHTAWKAQCSVCTLSWAKRKPLCRECHWGEAAKTTIVSMHEHVHQHMIHQHIQWWPSLPTRHPGQHASFFELLFITSLDYSGWLASFETRTMWEEVWGWLNLYCVTIMHFTFDSSIFWFVHIHHTYSAYQAQELWIYQGLSRFQSR